MVGAKAGAKTVLVESGATLRSLVTRNFESRRAALPKAAWPRPSDFTRVQTWHLLPVQGSGHRAVFHYPRFVACARRFIRTREVLKSA